MYNLGSIGKNSSSYNTLHLLKPISFCLYQLQNVTNIAIEETEIQRVYIILNCHKKHHCCYCCCSLVLVFNVNEKMENGARV